ncbi:uncharacterized protein LY89DRAFT_358973 [Mollisia scopiformis]|uniref:Uncharacterized protein n=1 Tax=Mollisia scopiformis TaxID=149040 RepID=A0A132B5A5_MOLSC|nr:uncharacterized protein LY89DRAFT_358973 [Mollisia scopiformis]KUJ07596.1 hypothetical protein LY89DRAFT_358973 [Mollisia scopiformis]
MSSVGGLDLPEVPYRQMDDEMKELDREVGVEVVVLYEDSIMKEVSLSNPKNAGPRFWEIPEQM